MSSTHHYLRLFGAIISICVTLHFFTFFVGVHNTDVTIKHGNPNSPSAASSAKLKREQFGSQFNDEELDEVSAEYEESANNIRRHRGLQEVNLTKAGIHDVIMISDMETTNQLWPWPETSLLVKECVQETPVESLGELPSVAVVITFHNEESLVNLLHTLHSVTQRSSPALLREVVVVDDGSTRDEFSIVLPNYVRAVFRGVPVTLLKNKIPQGLVKSRLAGIKVLSSDIVVVLDSHVEVQPGWLEPLVREIMHDRTTLASSYLDWMSKTDSGWEYKHGGSTWKTVFDWTFLFSFQDSSHNVKIKRRLVDPVRSPIMIGGAWAMDVDYFNDVGALDEDMEFWGGENIDLSIRVWLMGGRVVNIPCSHVGHFESASSRAYRNGKEGLAKLNYKRVVDVWFDEYSRNFYQAYPELKNVQVESLEKRRNLKKKARHTFEWYLTNVFPELGVPDQDSYAFGRLTHTASGLCFNSRYALPPTLHRCDRALERDQGVYWSRKGELRFPMLVYVYTNSEKERRPATIMTREATELYKEEQVSRWIHWKDGPLIDAIANQCLTAEKKTETWDMQMQRCVPGAANQTWAFTNYANAYQTMLETPNSHRDKHCQQEVRKYHALLAVNS